MDITFNGEFKSLQSFELKNLTGFTVITGKNGSGKSQFLELLELEKTGRQDETTAKITSIKITPPARGGEIQVGGLETERTISKSRDNWYNAIDAIRNAFSVDKRFKLLVEQLLNKNVDLKNITSEELLSIYDTQKEALAKLEEVYLLFVPGGNPVKELGWESVCQRISGEIAYRENAIKIYDFLAKFYKKSIADVTYDDLRNAPVSERLLSTANLFTSEISEIIYFYYKRRYENLYQKFLGSELKLQNNAISDADFLAENPKPEELFNSILADHHFPYYIRGLGLESFSRFEYYSFPLFRRDTETIIPFENLSSGEKVIIGLISKIFFLSFFEGKLQFPKLLLLDEPDALLHPEMSKVLIDVLVETFVKRYEINIIMTTHSPSTIALTPENSIWQLQNTPVTEFKKITKDEALCLLTQNLPTLSIDYKNHRQVFVESETDLNFYQLLFDKIYCHEKTIHRLYFISNTSGKGSCSQVKKITTDLRECGIKTVWGIIDWDKKNTSDKHVLVHGEQCRYTIENYLCDPIYLVALFINRKANNVIKELGLSTTYAEYSIGEETNERLQKFADWVINKIETKNKSLSFDSQTREVEYYNGKKLHYPIWLLEMQGHELFRIVKESFPSIEKSIDSQLKLDLATIAVKCYPFIPKESVTLLKLISEK